MEEFELFDDEMGEVEYFYILDGCCMGKGRSDGKECCGGSQCCGGSE